jgi:hypothetical protein
MNEIIEKFEHCVIAKSPSGVYVLSPHKFSDLKSSRKFKEVTLVIAKKKVTPCGECKDRLKGLTGSCNCYFSTRIRWYEMRPNLKDFHSIHPILCMKGGPDFRRQYFRSDELDIGEETVERNRKIAMKKLERNKYTRYTVQYIRRMLGLSDEG